MTCEIMQNMLHMSIQKKERKIIMGWKLLIIFVQIQISYASCSLFTTEWSFSTQTSCMSNSFYLPHPFSLSFWDIFCCLTEHLRHFSYSTDTALRFPSSKTLPFSVFNKVVIFPRTLLWTSFIFALGSAKSPGHGWK